MNLTTLPKSKELLDIAFRRARKKAAMLKSERNTIKDAKGKNITKIEESANYVSEAMRRAVQEFPSVKKTSPFYRELIESTIDLDATLKALGHLTEARKILKKLKGRAIGEIKGLKKEEYKKAGQTAREFYGRMSGLVKKLDKSVEKYNQAARKLRELPKIKTGMQTVIIAGLPNTGKTTVLGRLTKSKPKVASYPFTTQKLEIGYLEKGFEKIQVIDTPGLLDRPLSERNRIERKAIAALRHLANAVVFVVDPTMRSGFSLEAQSKLLEEIRKEFGQTPIIVAVNKADLATKEEIEKAKKEFGKASIEGKGVESDLKGEITKALGSKKEKDS